MGWRQQYGHPDLEGSWLGRAGRREQGEISPLVLGYLWSQWPRQRARGGGEGEKRGRVRNGGRERGMVGRKGDGGGGRETVGESEE